jgi:3-deoxy-D-manno-octulosonic acid kinase
MKPCADKLDSQIIVYDADCIKQANSQLFDEDAWKSSDSLVGTAQGRGSALFLDTSFGSVVLRRYLRGGWAANFSRDRYLFTGYQRSRPVAEFNILVELQALGLAVPHPLAALCRRDGMFYTGALMTRRIEDVVPLADLLANEEGNGALWSAVGKCIRGFHDNGVVHADLNARNILVRARKHVYLIDFDRARIVKKADSLFEANLKRLRRSLIKVWPAGQAGLLQEGWARLLEAYAAESTN